MAKRGTLTIVGSGIASVAHITLETAAHIKEAEKIFYVVCDPITEAYIQDNATGTCFDLTVFYDANKNRNDSYVQMCEVMLRAVRENYHVLGIFYGHPGVFVSPSHKAIAIARSEGFKAKMLPGISAEDYMFSDLEFDPCVYGCTTCEATELLLRNRRLNPTTHNIIWQVGCVGVTTMAYDNSTHKFQMLVDLLEKDFGPDHKVIHYIGAISPLSATIKDTLTVAELRQETVFKKIKSTSTLYIPPRDIVDPDNAVVKKLLGTNAKIELYGSSPNWDGSKPTPRFIYNQHELKAIAEIDKITTPAGHKILHASQAIKKFLIDLSLKLKLRDEYNLNPAAAIAAAEGLTELERFALKGNQKSAFAVMKATQSDIQRRRQLTEEDIIALMVDSDGGASANDTVVLNILSYQPVQALSR